jgi:putative nucleotidyltransferase with HDIG domain
LRELLNNENLKEALSEMDSLPSVPTLYFELEKELQSSDPSIQNVGNIIGQDPGMTAKILQLANSPFFGLRRSISNPAETVAYLGLDRIQHLFLALHIFSQFKNINSSAFSIELLWEHSLSTAIQAKEIASDEEADKGIREDSFTAGLLHDFGKLLFASKLPEKYDRAVSIARTDNIPLCQAEVKVLGVTHAEIGAYLFGIWGLPNSIVEAVAYHHHPADCGNNVFCSLTALHAADCKNVDRSNPGVPPPQLDIDYLSQHLVKTKSRILSH